MKELNNKGFAISTLIYGLSIMAIMIVAILLATMAQTRSNTNLLVKSIEEDLNRFSRTETSFKPTGSGIVAQEYIVPSSGWYRIELFGAQGANNGGKGAYTGGVLELTEGETLYFYVGKQPTSGGGYSSSVRVIDGSYNDAISYETAIMVAAGGGSSSTASGGTLYGYNDKMASYGGFINVAGNTGDFGLLATTAANNNTNGTLVGYNKNYAVSTATTPTIGKDVSELSPVGTNGGGDGYFSSNNSSTGGTSFIAGYAGCYGLSKGKTTVNAKVEYYEHKYIEEETVVTDTYHDTKLGEYLFIDGVMMPGVHSGDGYAKIERVKEKETSTTVLKKKNDKLKNIRYIQSCSNGNVGINKIVAVVKGVSIEKTAAGTDICKTVDLGATYDVDEIAVFHTTSGKDYIKDKIKVSSDQSSWRYLKGKNDDTEPNLSETETPTGYRVSAYQYDAMAALPTGNYIIQPVLSENKVLTASTISDENANPVSLDLYNGDKKQKWSVELITDKRINKDYNPDNPSTYLYKILESEKLKALAISKDENIVFNAVSTMNNFNDKAKNEPQIWKITPVGNGTYKISTIVEGASANTGNLIAQTNSTKNDNYNQIIIGRNNDETARFKFIQVDYSSN
jgi:hypothetical protein